MEITKTQLCCIIGLFLILGMMVGSYWQKTSQQFDGYSLQLDTLSFENIEVNFDFNETELVNTFIQGMIDYEREFGED